MADQHKPEFKGADPKRVFYIWGDAHTDGSLEIENEGKEPYSLEEVREAVMNLVDENGGEYFIVECRCIYRVKRGQTIFSPIKVKP